MNPRYLTQILTFSGALPFYLLLIPGLPLFDDPLRLQAFLAYGAVIASFMAGTVWGMVQREIRPSIAVIIASNVVALGIWGSLLLPNALAALILQLFAFSLLLGVDRLVFNRGGEQDWYFSMRIRITALVVLAYLIRLTLPFG
ncbi:DUF3429 domain-containing protein [Rhizobium helianthi]|uniref:DUF3429 domain-containing protein n=1 Tax=Rhizobium helianthi TaxID=1132695 RepID=A0ABW4M5H2_9HYPH